MREEKFDTFIFAILALIAFIVFCYAPTVIYNINNPHRSYSDYFGQDGTTFDMKEYLIDNGWDNITVLESAIQDCGHYDEGSVPCIYATSPFGNKLYITGENFLVMDSGQPAYSERMTISDRDHLVSINEQNPNCKMYLSSIETIDAIMKNKRF